MLKVHFNLILLYCIFLNIEPTFLSNSRTKFECKVCLLAVWLFMFEQILFFNFFFGIFMFENSTNYDKWEFSQKTIFFMGFCPLVLFTILPLRKETLITKSTIHQSLFFFKVNRWTGNDFQDKKFYTTESKLELWLI